mmetsp:Transcript_26173/g.49441  ORF Transcript_26173/g.49441 Transcript_26173/m.49441 type:complete len:422 (+) Transcript_26173:4058-5323(+)
MSMMHSSRDFNSVSRPTSGLSSMLLATSALLTPASSPSKMKSRCPTGLYAVMYSSLPFIQMSSTLVKAMLGHFLKVSRSHRQESVELFMRRALSTTTSPANVNSHRCLDPTTPHSARPVATPMLVVTPGMRARASSTSIEHSTARSASLEKVWGGTPNAPMKVHPLSSTRNCRITPCCLYSAFWMLDTTSCTRSTVPASWSKSSPSMLMKMTLKVRISLVSSIAALREAMSTPRPTMRDRRISGTNVLRYSTAPLVLPSEGVGEELDSSRSPSSDLPMSVRMTWPAVVMRPLQWFLIRPHACGVMVTSPGLAAFSFSHISTWIIASPAVKNSHRGKLLAGFSTPPTYTPIIFWPAATVSLVLSTMPSEVVTDRMDACMLHAHVAHASTCEVRVFSGESAGHSTSSASPANLITSPPCWQMI